MSENSEVLMTRIGLIVVSAVALVIAYLALDKGYLTVETFLIVFWAVLGAWGISAFARGSFESGKKFGEAKGFAKGLEVIADLYKTQQQIDTLKSLAEEVKKGKEK